ncbi:MAG TPA: ABC transporter permease [Gemmatimonadaceae bacterium]|nr:ABC transporter permease [Gemmatimonadaceae bacterium]
MSRFRTAFRSLRATPLVTTAALLSLALGIGANTAIFSIVDALLLKPLPVAHADRITVMRSGLANGSVRRSFTNPIWEAIRAHDDRWDGAFAAGNNRFNGNAGGEVDPIDGAFVSGSYFDVLGVQPRLGRVFTVDDDRRGGGLHGPVVVISHRFWQQRYAGATDAIGQTLQLSNVAYTIIGVAPAGFLGHNVGLGMDVWVPLGTEPLIRGSDSWLDRRSTWWLNIFVRRRADQSVDAASAALEHVRPEVRAATEPENWRPADLPSYLAQPFALEGAPGGVSTLRTRYQRPLIALAAVVGLTLLIACGNIANLMLARASARRHEFAVRSALGASRWRVAQDLLAENLLLSLAGAALGLLVALWASQLIVSQISTSTFHVALDLGLDARMLLFTSVVAVGTTLLFGVGPALMAASAAPMAALKEQGRGSGGGRHNAFANSLVIAQVSLSVMLIVGAGLFVRSFVALAKVDLGFAPDRALVMTIGTQRTGIQPTQREALFDELQRRVLDVPGVTHAGLSVLTPVSGNTWNEGFEFAHLPNLPEGERIVDLNFITPGWFATYGSTLLRGRDIEDRDRIGTPRVGVVNESFVRKYFGGMDPIGQTVRTSEYPGQPSETIEIVGVVKDAVYRSPREDFGPVMYQAYRQAAAVGSSSFLTVRSSRDDVLALQSQLTDALRSVHPELTVTYRPLADYVHEALAQERLVAMLSGFFGGLALLLAAIGLYGITAHTVVRRRGEIGIRLALGAPPARVVREILSRTGLLVLSGIVAGGLASWWLARFVATLLFGLEPSDPVTLATAMLLLAAVSAVAAWIPARRAALVNPLEALNDG